MRRGPGSICASFAFGTLISGAAAGCGGKLLPVAEPDDGGGDDGSIDASASGDDAGPLPVIDSVTPDSGPNAGGTRVTITGSGFTVDGGTFFAFAGYPASGITCTSEHRCEAVTPYAGDISFDQTVHVQATLGSPANPSEQWSVTRPQDRFTFTGGPPCTGTLICVGIYLPTLKVTCQPTVNFYLNPLYSDEKLLATGQTVQVDMQNEGAQAVAACYGGTRDSSCTSFTTFTELKTYCGGTELCQLCKADGGWCSMDQNGNVTCSKSYGSAPGGG